MTERTLYFYCNGGDYFSGDSCPLDGFSTPEIQATQRLIDDMLAKGNSLSIAALREAGADPGVLGSALLIEKSSSMSTWSYFTPTAGTFCPKCHATLREPVVAKR